MARNYFSVAAGIVALVTACTSATEPTLDPGAAPVFSVSFPAEIQLSAHVDSDATSPNAWLAAVRFTNVGQKTATIEHGACSVAVWLYDADAQAGGPVWDNRLPPNAACIAIGYSRQVPPGSYYDLATRIDRALIGNTIPAGNYKVVLAIRPGISGNTPLRVLPAGEITLGN